MLMRGPRVLVLAEAANPEWPSVPLVGWSHYRALARKVDAHLVTHVRNLDAIERAGLVEGRDFTAIDSERVAGPMWRTSEAIRKRLGLGATFTQGFNIGAYYYYEHLVMKQLGAQLRAHEFDLVHRLTPLSPVLPSLLAKECRQVGVPFVWGPINGGVPWPPGFGEVQRREGELLSAVRGLHKLLPGYRSTRENAAATLVASQITMSQVPDYARDRAVYLPENAIDPERFSGYVTRPVATPLRAAFVGRLVPLKGVDMLLEAAAPLLRNGALVLDIIGDGPERPQLEVMVEAAGTTESVTFAGFVPHEELSTRLVQSDLFVFPSIREFGGGAVLEAMALGLLPVIVDYAGPSELVTDDTGVRVPLGSRSEIVSGLREELSALVAEPHVIREKGERARERVLSLFTWDAKAAQTFEVYRWVLGERDKPDFGMPLR
jgi:glycosyltransferase involved in cell wall biosynthesis